MERKAFKMFLLPGFEEEYKRRHDEIWPELAAYLKTFGIANYSIFLDEQTLTLFAYLEAPSLAALDNLPNHPIMAKWWSYMKDLMLTNEDNSPVSVDLPSVFYMP